MYGSLCYNFLQLSIKQYFLEQIMSSVKKITYNTDDYDVSHVFLTIGRLTTPQDKLYQGSLTSSSSSQSSQAVRQKKLRQIFIKAKSTNISNIFIQKLMRKVTSNEPNFIKIRQKQKSKSIKGFKYPEELQNILDILHIMTAPLLIVLTSFLGFIPEFSQQHYHNAIVIIINTFCFFVEACRFFIKCTRVTFSEGQQKKYLRQIISSYLKSNQLIFDALLVILQGLCLIFTRSMAIAGILFFYLNFMSIFAENTTLRIQAAWIDNKKTALLWSLVKIILFNLFFAHFMSSVILAMANINNTNNWMVRANIQHDEWYMKYLYAYYWATTIMMTVGFGDLLPAEHNSFQIFITSFLEMFSCIVLGYNISSIGNIVTKLRDSDQSVNRKIVIFERMMRKDRKKKVNINPLLEKKISNYLKQLRIDKDNLDYIERDELLQQLPQNLRRAYYKEANKRIFPSVIFFRRLNKKTLQILAEKFKSQFFNSGEELNQQHNILILEQGKIGLAYKRRGSTRNGLIIDEATVQQCQDTLLLNGNQFLTYQAQKKYELISKQNCIIWSISKEVFIQVIGQSLIDKQYYFNIIHKHQVDLNQWQFINCQRCSTTNCERFHTSFICPRVTYLPVRSMITNFYISSPDTGQQSRVSFKRNKSEIFAKNILCLKQNLLYDYGKMQKSQKFIREVQQNSITQFNAENNQQIKNEVDINDEEHIKKQQKIQIMNEQALKRLLKQVLFEYQTGYEEDYWYLQCDKAYDYQFYFPQDNPNRLCTTHIYKHPRQFYKYYGQQKRNKNKKF